MSGVSIYALRISRPSVLGIFFQTGAHEDARVAPGPRVDARGDDPDPLRNVDCLTNRISQMASGLSTRLPRKSTWF